MLADGIIQSIHVDLYAPHPIPQTPHCIQQVINSSLSASYNVPMYSKDIPNFNAWDGSDISPLCHKI